MDKRQIVHNIYFQVLRRPADQQGLDFYSTKLRDGSLDENSLRNILEQSPENKNNYRAGLNLWKSVLGHLRYIHRDYAPTDIPQRSDKAIIMVETRPNVDAEPVLKQFLKTLKGWSLHIFCGPENRLFFERMTSAWNYVHLHTLSEPLNSVAEYNTLLKKSLFWEAFKEEKILVIQPDTLIRKPDIEEFMMYDYIGAPWSSPLPSSNINVGNGGLSLRSRDAMIECCRVQEDELTRDPMLPEDVYFSWKCIKSGFKVADVETAKRFSVESVWHPDPLGMHKPYVSLTSDVLSKLLCKFL